jgi:hypothetical protein
MQVLGNLSLITSQDLKFSPEEVSRIADLNGADIDNDHSRMIAGKMRWLAGSGSDDYSGYCARKPKFTTLKSNLDLARWRCWPLKP